MNITTPYEEINNLNMNQVLRNMNSYARLRLLLVDIKQLDGRTPDDIVQDTILKVLEGTRSWKDSTTNNFTTFLFGCLTSEIRNLLKKIDRKGNMMWNVKEYMFNYNESSTIYLKNNDIFAENLAELSKNDVLKS